MDFDLRPLARQQLLDIYDWTADRFGEPQADRYLRQINETIETLCTTPHIGPIFRGRVRRFVTGRHLIYYQINRDRIVIIRIDHGAQQRR